MNRRNAATDASLSIASARAEVRYASHSPALTPIPPQRSAFSRVRGLDRPSMTSLRAGQVGCSSEASTSANAAIVITAPRLARKRYSGTRQLPRSDGFMMHEKIFSKPAPRSLSKRGRRCSRRRQRSAASPRSLNAFRTRDMTRTRAPASVAPEVGGGHGRK